MLQPHNHTTVLEECFGDFFWADHHDEHVEEQGVQSKVTTRTPHLFAFGNLAHQSIRELFSGFLEMWDDLVSLEVLVAEVKGTFLRYQEFRFSITCKRAASTSTKEQGVQPVTKASSFLQSSPMALAQ